MKQEWVIQVDKRKVFYYLVASICMFFVFITAIYIGLFTNYSIQETMMSFMIFLILGAFYFGYSILFHFKRLTKSTLLKIDCQGITDTTTAFSLGFINWEHIHQIHIKKGMNHIFLECNVDEQVIQNRGMKTWVAKFNQMLGHEAVCITLDESKWNIEEVKEIMDRYRK